MYYYFQKSEKSKWDPIPATSDAEKIARSYGAIKMTVLSVSEVIEEGTEKENLKHKGPLYFDIDCKGDLKQAAESTVELIKRLVGMGLREEFVKVYASGGKGFHLMIPAKLFSADRATKNLPRIYSAMAMELYVHGLDFQVYSSGRGNCWRLSNLKREDGNYRVRIGCDELYEVARSSKEKAEELYRNLVKAPRPDEALPEQILTKCAGLSTLFEQCKARVKDKTLEKAVSGVKPLSDEDAQTLGEEPPGCVELLAQYKVRNGKNFNQAAMQFGAWAARSSSKSSVWKPRAERMADSGTSTKYTTHRKRLEHIEGVVHRLQHDKNFQFSCYAMRGVVGSSACDDCPLADKLAKDQGNFDGLELSIEARDDGYYLLGQEKERRVTTFTLVPMNQTVEKSQSQESSDRRVSTQMEVRRQGETLRVINFDESGWASRSAFIHQLEGIDNLSYLGSDADVQKIKHIVYEGDMGTVVRVHSVGVHKEANSRDRNVLTYVEPGYSVDEYRVKNTYEVVGKIIAPPKLKGAKIPRSDEEKRLAGEALRSLIKINSRENVAQILGWYAACHLKTHFSGRFSQFPILSLWGKPGSGKTMTASLFAWINGVDFTLEDSPLNLSSVTAFAMMEYCSSSTTIPRLLDEYNKSKISRRDYDRAGETIKAAWNSQSLARGTIANSRANGRTGAELTQYRITGPLVVMSEQQPETPAVQQRCIQLMLDKRSRVGCEGHFERASDLREHLRNLAVGLVQAALETPVSWIEERMSHYTDWVPFEMDERPRYSFKVALVGLDFLESSVARMGVDDEGLIDELRQAFKGFLDRNAKEISRSKRRSEVDLVLEDIGVMTVISQSGNFRWIEYGRSVFCDPENRRIYIDAPIVHAMYKSYKGNKDNIPLDRCNQFTEMLKQEDYFVQTIIVERMNSSRPMYELNMDKMEEKGLDTTTFLG